MSRHRARLREPVKPETTEPPAEGLEPAPKEGAAAARTRTRYAEIHQALATGMNINQISRELRLDREDRAPLHRGHQCRPPHQRPARTTPDDPRYSSSLPAATLGTRLPQHRPAPGRAARTRLPGQRPDTPASHRQAPQGNRQSHEASRARDPGRPPAGSFSQAKVTRLFFAQCPHRGTGAGGVGGVHQDHFREHAPPRRALPRPVGVGRYLASGSSATSRLNRSISMQPGGAPDGPRAPG